MANYSGDDGGDDGEEADDSDDGEDEGNDDEPELVEEEMDKTGSAPASPGTGVPASDHQGDPEYYATFTTLYPFSAVDFFISEKRDTGAG